MLVQGRAVVEIDWENSYAKRFRDAMEDDFNTPIAFAVLHDLRGEVNRSQSTVSAGLLKALGATIGLFQHDAAAFVQGAHNMNVDALIAERNTAKKEKNFVRADEIRKQLDAAGIVLEDKPGGVTEWRRK